MKSRVPADATPTPASPLPSSSRPHDGGGVPSFSHSLLVPTRTGRLNDQPSAPRHPTAVSYECSKLTYFAALLEDMNGDGGDEDESMNIFRRVQDRLVAKHLNNGTLAAAEWRIAKGGTNECHKIHSFGQREAR